MNWDIYRIAALVCACIYKANGGWSVDSVLDTARQFNGFLNGERE